VPHKDPIVRKEYKRLYYLANLARIKVYRRKRYLTKTAQIKVGTRRYYLANHEAMKAAKRRYEKTHRPALNGTRRSYWAKLREQVIKMYGGKCKCCGECLLVFLAMDHIYGGGNRHRRTFSSIHQLYRWLREKKRAGFRVLCHNCNHSYAVLGRCPHNDKANKNHTGRMLGQRRERSDNGVSMQ